MGVPGSSHKTGGVTHLGSPLPPHLGGVALASSSSSLQPHWVGFTRFPSFLTNFHPTQTLTILTRVLSRMGSACGAQQNITTTTNNSDNATYDALDNNNTIINGVHFWAGGWYTSGLRARPITSTTPTSVPIPRRCIRLSFLTAASTELVPN